MPEIVMGRFHHQFKPDQSLKNKAQPCCFIQNLLKRPGSTSGVRTDLHYRVSTPLHASGTRGSADYKYREDCGATAGLGGSGFLFAMS